MTGPELTNQQIEDRWANLYGTFPTAEGDSLILRDEVMAVGLILMASEFNKPGCDPDACEVCNTFVTMWWELSNDLDSRVRVRYQRVMQTLSIPLPSSPLSVEVYLDLPTSQR